MTKKRKRRKKVNFSEVRYSKRLKGTSDSGLSDEVFWPVYYGICSSGILSQFRPAVRWHAIQCLEGGFEGNDAGLLESRQVLRGMLDEALLFRSRYISVMESAAFRKRARSLDALSIDKKVVSRCAWTARAGRADMEFMCGIGKAFQEFYIRMGFSSDFENDTTLWVGLLMNYVDHVSIDRAFRRRTDFSSGSLRAQSLQKNRYTVETQRARNKDCSNFSKNKNGDKKGLRDMIPVQGLALVEDCVKSELKAIDKFTEFFDPECRSKFRLYLARRRAAYVAENPEFAALDEKNGHSNFGLDIDVCQLKAEII